MKKLVVDSSPIAESPLFNRSKRAELLTPLKAKLTASLNQIAEEQDDNGSEPNSPQRDASAPSSPSRPALSRSPGSRSLLPRLTKPGYVTSPTLSELSQLSPEDLSKLTYFAVELPGAGKVEWKDPTGIDVRSLDLDRIVEFSQSKPEVRFSLLLILFLSNFGLFS